MNKWRIIEKDPLPPALNMQRDRELLKGLRTAPEPVLHLYEWDGPSATYGHFVRPEKWINLEQSIQIGLQLARRPTGGGIIFHTGDLAFSLLIPLSHPLYSSDPLQSYRNVNQVVLEVIQDFVEEPPDLLATDSQTLCQASGQFCMAKPTIYDVMLGARKVGGAAQRRTRWGFLHQGSIAMVRPTSELLELLPVSVGDAMAQNGHYLLEDPQELKDARVHLAKALVERLY